MSRLPGFAKTAAEGLQAPAMVVPRCNCQTVNPASVRWSSLPLPLRTTPRKSSAAPLRFLSSLPLPGILQIWQTNKLRATPRVGTILSMSTRTYIADITTATSGLQIQIQRPGRLKELAISVISAAAGKFEVSRSPTTTIGTAQPDPSSVICRGDIPGAADAQVHKFACDVPLSTLDRLYVFMTGAANLGTVNLCVVEGGR